MEEELMRIGEIAAFYHLSPKALRLYEKKKIIQPVKVDEATGYRYYSANQVKQLNTLIELQGIGFSLKEIKKIMTEKLSKEDLILRFNQKRIEWEQTIASAKYKMEAIDAIKERIDRSAKAKKMDTMTEEERANLLANMVCVEDIRTQSSIREAIWL